MEAGAAFYNDPSGHKCEEAYPRVQARPTSSRARSTPSRAWASATSSSSATATRSPQYKKYLEGKGDKLDAGREDADRDRSERAQGRGREGDASAPTARACRSSTCARRRGGYPITNRYALAGDRREARHPPRRSTCSRRASEGAPDQTWKVEIANGGTLRARVRVRQGQARHGATASITRTARRTARTPDRAAASAPVPDDRVAVGGRHVAAARQRRSWSALASRARQRLRRGQRHAAPSPELEEHALRREDGEPHRRHLPRRDGGRAAGDRRVRPRHLTRPGRSAGPGGQRRRGLGSTASGRHACRRRRSARDGR